MAPPTAPTTVRFTLRAAGSRPGQAVVLVGDAPATGGWAPDGGVRLSTDASTFPVWCSPPVEVTSAARLPLPLSYKYVLAAVAVALTQREVVTRAPCGWRSAPWTPSRRRSWR